jgi:hypothetical protein
MNDTSVCNRIADVVGQVVMGAGSMKDTLTSVRTQPDLFFLPVVWPAAKSQEEYQDTEYLGRARIAPTLVTNRSIAR